MSNCCCSDYCFVSNNKERLKELYVTLEKTPKKYGTCQMQQWFETIGYAAEQGEDMRSDIMDYSELNDTGDEAFFTISTDDAWTPKEDAYAKMLLTKYPDVWVCCRADEAGCDVYVNTDTTGKYFPMQYRLDVCLPGRRPSDDGCACEDFNSAEECLAFMKVEFGIDAKTIEEANDAICDIIDKDGTGCAFGGIHAYL